MPDPTPLLVLAALLGGRAQDEPPTPPESALILPGELMHAELGCARCHEPFPGAARPAAVVAAPSLERVGAQRSPAYLRRYLADPLHVRPGTRMPDVLAGLAEAERAELVEDLVHYLASRGGPFARAPFGATAELLDEGRQLYHEVGCVACHGPEEPLEALYEPLDLARDWQPPASEGAPDLELLDLAEKTNVAELAAFLRDPLATRRSGRMPALDLTVGEAEAIAAYLLRAQIAPEALDVATPGLRWSYYEVDPGPYAPEFAGLTPARTGVVRDELALPAHREDRFAVVFEGRLPIREAGRYAFRTRSDDGTTVWIDGALVVDNSGDHAAREARGTVELDAGEHALRITYDERAGEEVFEAWWSGPGFAERRLRGDDGRHRAWALAPPDAPFALDPARAQRGEGAFAKLGCAGCHDLRPTAPRPYAEFDAAHPTGCLADEPVAGVPHYGLSQAQLADLRAALAHPAPPREPSPAEDAALTLRGARCNACHVRADVGGPSAARLAYFFADEDIDLGEEGRVPPHLDGVGAKLTEGALRRVLFEGERVRPYLYARMPHFGPDALDGLVEALAAADAPADPPAPPSFDPELARDGQRLAGTQGFGCIQCHWFAGYPSLGIPAVDLATVHERVQYPWFRELLREPGAINMNTRMPGFWIDGESPVKDVLGGDKDAQIDALWVYLSQGAAMPLPHGLVTPDSAYELVPEDGPLLAGVFMDGVSPRTVAVGLPENVHYAFDVEDSRLAFVWRGRFFNARGTWEGRAGQLERPGSDDVLTLPTGPPFARLARGDAPWPDVVARRSPLHARGRRTDAAHRPIWRYTLGAVEIEEHLVPVLDGERVALERRLALRAPAPLDDLWFRGTNGARQRVVFHPDPAGEGSVAELTELLSW
ncbi:MAG: c-type cytochrome [Planctomycetes bacterium]|nr:c-type cytochrome [Planctomycetota bacterium]